MRPEASPPPSPALAAFLRGVERRAAVFAELQCGDAAPADRALAAAMAGFRASAAEEDPGAAHVMSEWPVRFWGLLLARPELHGHVPVRVELSSTDRLASLGAGPRAALLLSLAGGLDEESAAKVLGVTTPGYGVAVRRALAQLAGDDDQAALATQWRQLRDQVHRRIKSLPPDRQRALADMRVAALAGAGGGGGGGDAAAVPGPQPARARPRWLVPALWVLLVVCALAFLATFFGDALRTRLAGPEEGEVWSRSLEQGEEPASRFDRQVEVLTHRDFELLADPEGLDDARQLGFHSWLAAQGVSAPAPGAEPGLARTDAARLAPAAPTMAGDGAASAGTESVETDHEPR